MLFVLVYEPCYSCVILCFTHERVCNCLFRCHSMLFVLVMSRVTCVFTLQNECVIVVLHVFLLMNECVIVYSGVILCCSCSLM